MNARQEYIERLEDRAQDLQITARELETNCHYYRDEYRLEMELQIARLHAQLAAFERLFRQPVK